MHTHTHTDTHTHKQTKQNCVYFEYFDCFVGLQIKRLFWFKIMIIDFKRLLLNNGYKQTLITVCSTLKTDVDWIETIQQFLIYFFYRLLIYHKNDA